MISGRKLKGQFSFLTKGFLLIFMIIAMSLIINQIVMYQYNMNSISKEYDMATTSMNLIGILSNSEKCLALNEDVEIGGVLTNRTYTRILDIDKIEDFVIRYDDTEPECARNYLLGYNVTVELLPINMSYEYTPPEEITVLQKMLVELEGRNTIFVIDMSASMEERVGDIRKISCIKSFLEGFVDNLDAGQSIGLIGYGTQGTVDNGGCDGGSQKPAGCVIYSPRCGATELISPTLIGGNQALLKSNINNGITAEGCTPMAHGLVRGYQAAQAGGINDIVVLTDGCENCAGDSYCVAQQHTSSGIRIHTIAFGQTICQAGDNQRNCVCNDKMEQISQITGGQNYIARDCKELIRPPNIANAVVEKTEWKFGTLGHSEGKSLDGSVSISLPIVIKRGEELLPGFIRLSVYEGDLEAVAGLIDYVCRRGVESTVDTFIDMPMRYHDDTKDICIVNGDNTESCRKVDCNLPVSMSDITNPGRYQIYADIQDGRVNVIV